MSDRTGETPASGAAPDPRADVDVDAWAGESDWGQAAPLFTGRDPEFERDWLSESAAPAPGPVSDPPASPRPVGGSRGSRPAPGRAVAAGSVQRERRRPEPATRESADYGDQYGDQYDDDIEDFPAPKRGRAFLGFLLVLVVLAGGVLAGLRWYQHQIDPPGPPGAAVEVVIPNNTPTARIGGILHAKGIIGNATLFRYYAQYKGRGGFEAGRYKFRLRQSFDSVLTALAKGPSVPDQAKVTFPEGFRITQIAARVGAQLPGRTTDAFLGVTTSGKVRSAYEPTGSTNLEGFLFPETYTFTLDDDETAIASRMVETFDQVADQVGLNDSVAKVGISPYQTLIVASLVEREAKHDEDRAKIARVIYNRLKKGMPLQIDATIVYALGGVTRVLDEDLKLDSPFNSYTNKGLPPTPIASPGRASLEAALAPEAGDWLYYVVTTPDGHHSFATTFKQHQANIKLAQERGLR